MDTKREERIVLAVDDEKPILRLLDLTLEELGCRTVGALSAEQAIECLEELRPDVVITDYRLPGMNGVELAALLKSRPDTADVPVVLISAYMPPAQHAADRFLQKPLDIDELVSVVRRLLDGDGRR